jgi:integrase/recombinase XerD
MRLSEIVDLNWGEIDLRNGRIEVLQGKGKKYRIVIIDKETLHLMIRYHHELKAIDENLINKTAPVIQTNKNERMTPMGIRSIFVRIKNITGIHFSAHALRRTFAKMAIKNGMDIIWLQTLMGHANLETTRDYVQGLDIEDVEKAYQEHAPLKGMIKMKKYKI